MAPKQNKRTSPLDDPPTASSSDSSGEDEAPSSQPHPEEEDEEEASSEEQQQEEDEEEQQQQQHQPVSKNPPPTAAKPASSESDTDSGTESESDSPPPVSNFEVKPKASKPMEQTPKPKQKQSASKRPAENNGHANDPKRSKKKVTEATVAAASSDDEAEEDAKKAGASDSRKQFQRLWSEEDELAILKGMAEFKSKTGNDPVKYAEAFHDFLKKSLQAEASKNQLKEKIRRLKKKFETNAGKGKNGQVPSFSKPHDQESFELSKKVWGNAGAGGKVNGAVEKAKSNGKTPKSPKKEASKTNVAPSKPKPETKQTEVASKETKEAETMDIDEKIDTTPQLLELIRVEKGFGLYGLSEDMLKRGVELIGASQRAELEEQWKELQVAELEVSAKRAELVAKQTKLILEAYKSSNY